jgi:Spy/CpxP family protein refolding chaperone
MTPRGKTLFKVWMMVLGVFALGCLTGASLDSAYRIRARNNERQEKRGGRDKQGVFESMKRDLNLSEQQATEIRAILDNARNEYRTLRTEVRPRYEGVRQNARTRIRALLTPEQQQRFDAKVAERDAKRDPEDRDDH